jgi:Flp pilus assembly protein TadG
MHRTLARARKRRARPDRRRSRGAVAVEAALITPVFLVLVFGIIEFGLVFKDWLAVSSTVRAGARMASAEPRTATFASDAAAQVAKEGTALGMSNVKELWVYKANADGTPVGGTSAFTTCGTCVKFRWNGSAFTQTSSSWTSTQQNACQNDPNRDTIGVYLKYDHPAVTGLFFNSLTLSEHTVMALEPIPTATGCK